MKKVRNNLQSVKNQLSDVMNVLNQSITFNGEGYKNNDLNNLNKKIDSQIYNLNNKIISELNNM